MADMSSNSTLIRFLSKSTVRPASGGEFRRRIELTPCDLQCLTHYYNQRGLLFHRPGIPATDLVRRLKAALSRAMDAFFPLAGRLAVTEDADSASFFVDCGGGEGALFVHAAADGVSAEDVLAEPIAVPDEIFGQFFGMSTVLNCEAAFSELPLLAVQVTELRCGGVFVACSMNHVVADGTTFWHFLNVWSEISRCGDGPERPPQECLVFGGEFLDGVVDLPLRIPFSRDRIHQKIFPATALESRVVRFSKDKIAELKAKANATEAETGTSSVISSFQALMAHIWVCVTRSRRLDPDDQVIYVVAVGLRQRLEPPLPQSFFGNAVGHVIVRTTAGELLERGTGWAARQINGTIAALTPPRARKCFVEILERIREERPRSAMQGRPTFLMFTGSSPRFDVYGNDFGWGRPVAMRTGCASRVDGEATPFPGAEEGSIDFKVCLRPEPLRALANDVEFVGTIAK